MKEVAAVQPRDAGTGNSQMRLQCAAVVASTSGTQPTSAPP